MRLVFVRHGEPDYEHYSLTEKGWRESQLLVPRLRGEDSIDTIYCSPLGRALDTAKATLAATKMEPVICPWLKEFFVPVIDPQTGEQRIPWDFLPGWWTEQPEFYHKDTWLQSPVMRSGNVAAEYQKVCDGIDSLLAEYGYERQGNFYRSNDPKEESLIFFCHLGAEFAVLSHLLGIAPPLLWQGFFVAPSSLTILETEERKPGEAFFRCKTLGDTSHLYIAGEKPSEMGFFGQA